ncbi:unnamed protein product [Amaranthus hypochondriacus]
MEEFTYYGKRTVLPNKPIEAGKKIALSSLDLVMEKHYLQMVYYYNIPKGALPIGELTNVLRIALADVMSYFPIVAGRLKMDEDGKWMIECNDAGLRFIEAIAKGSVHTWLHNLDHHKQMKLMHWEDWHHIPYYSPTLYIMVTEFEEGGLAIGLSCSHLLSDPFSATNLIKAITDKLLMGSISIPPFFHPLPKNTLGYQKAHTYPKNHLINHYKTLLEGQSPFMTQKSETIAFQFTHPMVQACINLAHLNGPTNHRPDSSPFVALAALFWASISKVKGETNGLIDISLGLDVRSKLGLDRGYFGNCMIYTKCNGDYVQLGDIPHANKVIGDEIAKVNKEETIDLIEWLNNYKSLSPISSLDMGNLVISNLENVDPYSAVFMEGYEPIRIGYYNVSSGVVKGKVMVLPSHPSEGKLSRIVMVTLPHHEALKLCEDKLLARFSPSIIMGTNKLCS